MTARPSTGQRALQFRRDLTFFSFWRRVKTTCGDVTWSCADAAPSSQRRSMRIDRGGCSFVLRQRRPSVPIYYSHLPRPSPVNEWRRGFVGRRRAQHLFTPLVFECCAALVLANISMQDLIDLIFSNQLVRLLFTALRAPASFKPPSVDEVVFC